MIFNYSALLYLLFTCIAQQVFVLGQRAVGISNTYFACFVRNHYFESNAAVKVKCSVCKVTVLNDNCSSMHVFTGNSGR